MTSTNSTSLLALTGAAVALEIGLLVACLSAGESPAATGAVLGTFHVGYLLADRIAQSAPRNIRIGAVLGGLAVPASLIMFGALAACPAVFVTATSLQALRRQLKRLGRPPVGLKNLVKFSAMVVAGIAAWDIGLVAVGAFAAAAALIARGGSPALTAAASPPAMSKVLRRVLRFAEFAHHAHYFIYCYTFWRLAVPLEPWVVGPLFTVGWLAYFVAESVISRRLHFSSMVMGMGHLLCALCLGGMLMSSNLGWLMVMWFLTGIGGGTAYMLGYGPQAVGRERAEDWGHVMGTALGGVLASWTVSSSIWVAGAVALITALASFSLQPLIAGSSR